MSLGWLLAVLVLIGAFVLVLVARLDFFEGILIGSLALAVLLSSIVLPWRGAS